MIAFLKGMVEYKGEGMVWLDVGGVGYAVSVSERCLARLPEKGQQAFLFTYLQVTEGGVNLFGFSSQDEKALFERLIGVSGIGPKIAIAALSVFSPAEVAQAIALQDAPALSRIPGIGKKTAQRIILELKGSLDFSSASDADAALSAERAAPKADEEQSTAYQGAWDALLAMGFTSQEAELALKGASEKIDEGELLRYALKRLGSK